MIRNASAIVANSQALRMAVSKWKQELPESTHIAIDALNKMRQEVANDLDAKQKQWVGENKLIHAGAAKALADELRKAIK